MASLRVHPDRLEIHLTPAEKTLAFRRENLVISRDTIRSVTITDDPWIWVRGIRAPGALVPLVLAIGVWKFHGGKDFLAIKRRRQAVVIDLIGDEFARVILSTNHAPDLIASLKLDATDAQDVPELDESAAEPAVEDAAAAVPVKPAKRVRAARPAKPVEVAEPSEPAEPVKPVKPVKRTRVAKPAKPADAVAPADEGAPADAAEPSPAEKPVKRVRAPKKVATVSTPASIDAPEAPEATA
ncbi:hypothetical protein [Cryobacterium sp. AP23]